MRVADAVFFYLLVTWHIILHAHKHNTTTTQPHHTPKQERLKESQSWQTGGYAWRCNKKGSGSMRGGGTGGWEAMQQPAKQERLDKKQSWQA
jgi:hypothetical protein